MQIFGIGGNTRLFFDSMSPNWFLAKNIHKTKVDAKRLGETSTGRVSLDNGRVETIPSHGDGNRCRSSSFAIERCEKTTLKIQHLRENHSIAHSLGDCWSRKTTSRVDLWSMNSSSRCEPYPLNKRKKAQTPVGISSSIWFSSLSEHRNDEIRSRSQTSASSTVREIQRQLSKTFRTSESVDGRRLFNATLPVPSSLFTSAEEQLTDEETPDEGDENAQLLDEMSRTLEDLLGQHPGRLTISRQVTLAVVTSFHLFVCWLAPENVTHRSNIRRPSRPNLSTRGSDSRQWFSHSSLRQNSSKQKWQIHVSVCSCSTQRRSLCSNSKAYYALDETERETLRRERRRLQEQLRRVKRNELRYNQYEKQQMLFQIQQENLALLQSTCPSTASSSRPTSYSPNYPHASLALNLSDDDEESSSSKQWSLLLFHSHVHLCSNTSVISPFVGVR